MDRETRVFAESHFRSLRGRLPSRVCPTPDRVDFIENPDSFSYADFFKGYLLPNLPCVFSSAFTEGWGSRKHWVTPSGKPDFDYLLQNYGTPLQRAYSPCLCTSPLTGSTNTGTPWMWTTTVSSTWGPLAPGQEEALRDCHGGLPYDVTAPAFLESRPHPGLNHCSPPLEVMQEAGEMVFVPSGWHHQVHNMEDTISINHNWVNGCNLANMWHFLQQELCAVQREVGEWKDTMPDWHHHCQVIMRSCSGINFKEFYHFLKVIAERRLLLAKEIGPGEVEYGEGSGLGPQQTIFDISRIAEVLASVVVNPDFQKVDTSMLSPQPEDLLQQLEEVMASMEPL
ncbi:2-oxoglutarate and iron-dependent oxygenase JMJD4 isoform X6 [Phyllostomus discolor]|uniref:Jumonji domain-containing protein 4 n=1 Tax=Phyllostomus discolor TaxID=89673 RepID=A0A7E6EBH7_9CHIR|nr:2-oxoglutarate and iron-dependent oxygenase JMJD4 isoform X6 [Phyllostomus discolor]